MDIQAAAKSKVRKGKDFIKTEEVKVYLTLLFGSRITLILTMSLCTDYLAQSIW
jgi:hypothetical protein